ncbi:MAG: hypothetical protein ABWJ42_00045, partial [Sulfolobales archaeon]
MSISELYTKISYEISETLELISFGLKKGDAPKIMLFSAFLLVIAIVVFLVYLSDAIIRVASILVGLGVLVSSGRKRLGRVLKTWLYLILFALFLSLPSFLKAYYEYNYDLVKSVVDLMLVSVSSTTPLIVYVMIVGVAGVVKSISVLSVSTARVLSIFISLIPRVARIESQILLARISRNIAVDSR